MTIQSGTRSPHAKQTFICSMSPYRSKSYAANASGSVVMEEGCHLRHFLQTLTEAKCSHTQQALIKEFRVLVKAFNQWVSKVSSSRGSVPAWEKTVAEQLAHTSVLSSPQTVKEGMVLVVPTELWDGWRFQNGDSLLLDSAYPTLLAPLKAWSLNKANQ